jgi:hypothetical protein
MTVMFDVHDDEDRRQLEVMKKTHKRRLFGRPTDKDRKLEALEHNPFVDDFMRDIASRLKVNHMKVRTTYEIASFEELKEE